jgi:hypothetical protein
MALPARNLKKVSFNVAAGWERRRVVASICAPPDRGTTALLAPTSARPKLLLESPMRAHLIDGARQMLR